MWEQIHNKGIVMGDWCSLCDCNEPHKWLPEEPSFQCPLLRKKICETCCAHELMGGMGAGDTLEQVSKLTSKTPQEIYQTCKACEHGGPEVGELGEPIYINPDKKEESEEFQAQWKQKLEWLRGQGPAVGIE